MKAPIPTLVVSGYASVDYAMQTGPFEGHDATTVVRARADEWPRYGGIAHVTRAASRAARRGARVAALSWVGSDAEGDKWVHAVAREGTETSGIVRRGSRSPTSHLIYPEGQGTICLFDPGDCYDDALDPEQVALVAAADSLVVTIGPGSITRIMLHSIPEHCRLFWIVKRDPSSLSADLASMLAARASVVTLSDGERGFLDEIVRDMRPGTSVVITRGAEGSELHRVDSSGLLVFVGEVPAQPVAGVDTTGAGDTFSGTLAALIAEHAEPDGIDLLELIAEASAATASMLVERAAVISDTSRQQPNEERNA